LIGRAGTGNHLQLADLRISRRCAAIHAEGGRYELEDRGQQGGLFVNGQKIDRTFCRMETSSRLPLRMHVKSSSTPRPTRVPSPICSIALARVLPGVLCPEGWAS